jgi:hypothetical protein
VTAAELADERAAWAGDDDEIVKYLRGKAAAEELAEVWCSKCAEPATVELDVTDGARTYRAAYCDLDAWTIRGGGRG